VDLRPQFPPGFRLLLASQSPRRHSILRDIGVPFIVVGTKGEEVIVGGSPCAIAEANALAKLRGAVLPEDAQEGAFVLATDTIVTVGNRVLGKASSEDEAASMLALLSGRTHQVGANGRARGAELRRAPPAPFSSGSSRERVDRGYFRSAPECRYRRVHRVGRVEGKGRSLRDPRIGGAVLVGYPRGIQQRGWAAPRSRGPHVS